MYDLNKTYMYMYLHVPYELWVHVHLAGVHVVYQHEQCKAKRMSEGLRNTGESIKYSYRGRKDSS